MQPEEYERSRKKHMWELVQRLDVLHSELASMYRHPRRDQRRIDLIWRTIDELELSLLENGVDYDAYTQERRKAAIGE